MGDVYANGLEISGKAVNAKTIAVMPDVCFTPPENPATPPGIPIPYPSFGMAGDSENGTGTVFIGGKTVNIKNKSDESKTSGTEAGCAAKKGVITSKNTGKKYFNSWSSDVKFDGEPVIRFSDLATHNHASPIGNTPPGPEICAANPPPNYAEQECLVGSWEDIHTDCNARKDEADPTKSDPSKFHAWQAHHIVPDRCYRCGRTSSGDTRIPGAPSREDGVCICLPRLKHSAARPASGGNATVHHHLDQNLTDLGHGSPTSDSPKGCAPMEEVRDESLAALKKLVEDGTITVDCFKKAAKAVRQQTKSMAGRQVRAEKSLKDLSSTARGRLAQPVSP